MSLSIAVPDHVEADVNYLLHDGRRPKTYAYPPPPGVPQRSGLPDVQRVQIANARQLAEPPTLDSYGFERRSQPTAVTDFGDDEQIRTLYYREAEQILLQATGAEKVVIFDHTLRSSADDRAETTREPVRFVHNDQTFVSGPRRVRDHLPPDEAATRLTRRFAIVNLWRPIGTTVETWPLAVLDGRTIELDDLVAADLIYRDKVGETYAVLHRARHRWFYFPRMQPDEVILLKIYDSKADAAVRLSAHSAFEDPTSPSDAPSRRSIELRSLVFYRS
jgi:hypothetical protein